MPGFSSATPVSCGDRTHSPSAAILELKSPVVRNRMEVICRNVYGAAFMLNDMPDPCCHVKAAKYILYKPRSCFDHYLIGMQQF